MSLAGKLRLGALPSEIEPHVDQSLIRDEGGAHCRAPPRHPRLAPLELPRAGAALQGHHGVQGAGRQGADCDRTSIEVLHCGCDRCVHRIRWMLCRCGVQKSEVRECRLERFEVRESGRGGFEVRKSGEEASEVREELRGAREKLRELLRALQKQTLRALDDEVCYRLGLMKTRRTS